MNPLVKLHRSGWARLINCSSNSMNRRCTAYVETQGPRWLGRRLMTYVVRNHSLTYADWDTIHVDRCERVGRRRYRWLVRFERTPRVYPE